MSEYETALTLALVVTFVSGAVTGMRFTEMSVDRLLRAHNKLADSLRKQIKALEQVHENQIELINGLQALDTASCKNIEALQNHVSAQTALIDNLEKQLELLEGTRE